MRKLWSFSTTLRSPDRIIDFLRVLLNLENAKWNNENQKKYQTLLIQYRKYVPEKNNLSDESVRILDDINHKMTYEEAKRIFDEKNYQDPAMRGRTSFSPLRDLGLAYVNDDNEIVIPKESKDILNDTLSFSDYFMKWALKWQYPNPTSNDYIEGYNIKPLVGVLKLIDKVNTKWADMGNTPVGISKSEFSIFALSLTDINEVDNQVDKLINYRIALSKVPARDKNNFFKQYIEENLTDFSNATINNIKDYTDNAIRYFSLTNLIKKRGNGYYIDIVPSRQKMIDKLLKNEKGESDGFESSDKYLEYLRNSSMPDLSEDTAEIIQQYKNELFGLITENHVMEEELDKINNYSYRELIELKRKVLIKIDKSNYLNEDGINEIIDSLEHFRNLDIKPSLALEKWVSTALITLNDAIEIRPNYHADDDNNILFTAPPGVADIECYYKEFNSICEVTTLTGRDQWYNEGQPVMRHFKDFIDNHDKGVDNNYCLFIAPAIHRDTINTFWYSVKYEFEGYKLKIVPLSLRRFEEIIYALRKLNNHDIRFVRQNFVDLFDSICSVDNINNSDEWWTHVNETFERWKSKLIKNLN